MTTYDFYTYPLNFACGIDGLANKMEIIVLLTHAQDTIDLRTHKTRLIYVFYSQILFSGMLTLILQLEW